MAYFTGLGHVDPFVQRVACKEKPDEVRYRCSGIWTFQSDQGTIEVAGVAPYLDYGYHGRPVYCNMENADFIELFGGLYTYFPPLIQCRLIVYFDHFIFGPYPLSILGMIGEDKVSTNGAYAFWPFGYGGTGMGLSLYTYCVLMACSLDPCGFSRNGKCEG